MVLVTGGDAIVRRLPAAATLDRLRVPIGGGYDTLVRSRDLEGQTVGSVIKKRRKRMAKKKHRKLLKRTRIQRRRQGK